MTDYFKLLQEHRRPWIDRETLKSKFHAISADLHPDRTHNSSESEKQAAQARFTEVNSAYQCLSDPKARLSHLLELECGVKPGVVREIPVSLMEQFLEVGGICRSADAFLTEREYVKSPIARVDWFEKGLDWIEKLKLVLQSIEAKQTGLQSVLRGMNTDWESADSLTGGARREALPINRAEEIYNTLGFTVRWSEQLRERIVKLSV